MATPNKLTEEKRGQALAALRAGADLTLAARAIEVSREALEKLMQRDDVFRMHVNQARDFADETIVKRLYDKAREGDTTAMIFWLKNRKPREWRDRHDFRHEGHDGGALVVDSADVLRMAMLTAKTLETVSVPPNGANGSNGANGNHEAAN